MFPSLSLWILATSILPSTLAQSALPDSLLVATPECAFACIKALVAEDLSDSCPDTADLECLCSASSDNGFTLGEGALACVADLCTYQEYLRYGGIYTLCNQYPDALSATHATIAASAALPTSFLIAGQYASPSQSLVIQATLSTTSRSSSTSIMLTTSHSTSTSSSTSSTSSTPTTSSVLSLDTTIPPSTPSSFLGPSSSAMSSNAATSSPATAGPVLGSGQIAGIAVAGSVTAATAIGLLIFVFCGKKFRRHTRRRDSDASFGGSNAYPSDPEITADGRHTAEAPRPAPLTPAISRSMQGGPKQNQLLGLPVAPNQPVPSWWSSKVENQESLKPETPTQIGIAKHLTPRAGGISQETSPTSDASYRTTSRLLPEKPMFQPSGRDVHEKQTSFDTLGSQPLQLGGGVGLRVIAPTPEPSEYAHSHSGSYHNQEWPARKDSYCMPSEDQPIEGHTLKGKLSDPFLSKPNEKVDMSHPSAAMFNTRRVSRASLPRIKTVSAMNGPQNTTQRPSSQSKGTLNFRSLVQPQARLNHQVPMKQPTPPPRLPSVATFSPISPGLPASVPALVTYDPQNEGMHQGPMMNRGRPRPNPFFSSQQSQAADYRPYRMRSRRARPETHYTTGSDTEFEDDNNSSPLSPPDAPLMHIAELPSLSPVTESPASRTARDHITTRTPSPRVEAKPSRKDYEETPLSKVRYPEIPGKVESPRREVTTVPIALQMPREAKVVHVAQLHKASITSPIQAQREPRISGGTSAGSPYLTDASPAMTQDSSPKMSNSPRFHRKLIPSPLRPGRASGNWRHVGEDPLPPPVPPKDDTKTAYPSPPMSSPRDQTYQKAAKDWGDHVAASSSPDGLDQNAHSPMQPVELPARYSGGLGNWPVQPTRPSRSVASPRPQFANDYHVAGPSESSEGPVPSSILRVTHSDQAGFRNAPRLMQRPAYSAMAHGYRREVPARKAVSQGRTSEDSLNRPHAQGTRVYDQPHYDSDRWQYYENAQAESFHGTAQFDPSLSMTPLLPPNRGENGPRSVKKTWAGDESFARSQLLGQEHDMRDPRGV